MCFVLQVAGSIWYLLTVQRVESCIHLQCKNMPGCNYSYMGCPVPIAFSKQPLDDLRVAWAQNPNVTGCLQGGDDFGFGIYSLSVPLVTDVIPVNKILLPLFWGVMTMRYVSSHSMVEVDCILGVKDISPPIFYFISIFSITF